MPGATEVFKALKTLKCFDISPKFQNNMPMFGGNPNLWIIPNVRTYEKHTYYCQCLVLGEHAGPHIDAQSHIIPGGKNIDDYPCDYFIAPYKKYALDRFDPQPGDHLPLEMFKKLEEQDGFEPEEGDIILLQYGWSKHYLPDELNEAKRDWYWKNNPGLADDTMRYFAEKRVKAVGADTANCDGPKIDGKFFHCDGHEKYFMPNGILIMENFGDMSPAPATGIFAAIPLPIEKGSGCPVRPLLFG